MDISLFYVFHMWDIGNKIGYRCIVYIVEKYIPQSGICIKSSIYEIQ